MKRGGTATAYDHSHSFLSFYVSIKLQELKVRARYDVSIVCVC